MILLCWFLFSINLSLGSELQKEFFEIPLQDEQGKTASFNSFKKENRVLVLVFIASTCPVTSLYLERIKGMWYNYRDKGVDFYGVGGNSDDSIIRLREKLKERDLNLPLLWDQNHLLAKTLGLEFTPEAIVFTGGGQIAYRGLLDDSWREENRVQKPYLEKAIELATREEKSPDHKDDPFMGSHMR